MADEKQKNTTAPESPHLRSLRGSSHISEEKVIEQIETEDQTDEIVSEIERDYEPEEPTIINGEKGKTNWFIRLLTSKKFWITLVGIVLVSAIFAWLITPSRIWVLNMLNFKNSVAITTTAAQVGSQPVLKNVAVTINGASYHTDDRGVAHISLPYGQAHIVVSKPGFETITKDEFLDFDPFFYKFGGKADDDAARNLTFALKSVGIAITLNAKDWLTGQPVTEGNFAVGDITATPDQQGRVLLSVPPTDAKTAHIVATFTKNYANKTFDVSLQSAAAQDITILPSGRDYFISKRSGQFAVYSANIDGSDIAELVPPSASETGDISFSVSPSGKFGILASTREGVHNAVGTLLQKLYVVDTTTKQLKAVDQAERFTFADWSDDILVYTATQDGLEREASISAPIAKQTNYGTASAYDMVRVSLKNAVYLTHNNELRTVALSGGTEKTLGTGLLQVTQTAADRFAYQTNDKMWHEYNVNTDQVKNVATPTSLSRAFLNSLSADGQTQLLVDTIDGAQVLIAKKIGDGKETIICKTDFMAPVRWVGNVAVYRQGSADYAVSAYGGSPKKITDVSAAPNVPGGYFSFN